jgi:hypothetical protein
MDGYNLTVASGPCGAKEIFSSQCSLLRSDKSMESFGKKKPLEFLLGIGERDVFFIFFST